MSAAKRHRELTKLRDHLRGLPQRETWTQWRTTQPGVQVRDRTDHTGCEIAIDVEEGRDTLDAVFRHFCGIGYDLMLAEYPGVFDTSLGLDILRRAQLMTGGGHVDVDDPEDIKAVERVIGPLADRLGMPLVDYLDIHPNALKTVWSKRQLHLTPIPWARHLT